MITVSEFMDLCIELYSIELTLYSVQDGVEVWSGRGVDVPDAYKNSVVESFDSPTNIGSITLNIG